MMRTLFILLCFAWTVGSTVQAQEKADCPTKPTPEQLQKMQQLFQSEGEVIELGSGDPVTLVVTAHIIRRSNGTGGLSTVALQEAFDNVNNYYITANMQFEISTINFIDSDAFYDFRTNEEGAISANDVENTINIYFANSVANSSGTAFYCGYAYFPGGPDRILMDNSCTSNGSTLPHEIGHFFSLLHTHGSSNSTLTNELVDGSNCANAGDLVCDSPADPQLSGSNVNASCDYTGSTTDANGNTFRPEPRNIMSYAPKRCRDLFTSGQFERIIQGYTQQRNYLLTTSNVGPNACRTECVGNNLFIGNTPGIANTSGTQNTMVGQNNGAANTSGTENTFIGNEAGLSTTTGSNNTFIGQQTGFSNTIGRDNTYLGENAGSFNTTGGFNTMLGQNAGVFSNMKSYNTFVGRESGRNNDGNHGIFLGNRAGYNNTADFLVALGDSAGYSNRGDNNTFVGALAGAGNTTGNLNTFVGYRSGENNATGSFNAFFGYHSGLNNTGFRNTFLGYRSGESNTTASDNTFIGEIAGFENTTGAQNTFTGTFSGQFNTTGTNNTFTGRSSGRQNRTGSNNTFMGERAGEDNLEGSFNAFFGQLAGSQNTIGNNNTFLGQAAGQNNTSGDENTFIGFQSGQLNTSGRRNTFLGAKTGINNSTGAENTFFGFEAGLNTTAGGRNVFIGNRAGSDNTTGSFNMFLGAQAGIRNVDGERNTYLGYEAGSNGTSSRRNVFLGYRAGKFSNAGEENVFLGHEAGLQNISGEGNVFVGNRAGYFETGSDKLYIDNRFGSTPLIWGDFQERVVGINTKQFSDGGDIFTLSVNGKVRATEVKVYTGLADFVFEEDYDLPSLDEVEAYIREHGHLPAVPSEEEVSQSGIFLGQMNATLLQKIEELTLYTIQQEKDKQALQKELSTQKKTLEDLQNQVNTLIKLMQEKSQD